MFKFRNLVRFNLFVVFIVLLYHLIFHKNNELSESFVNVSFTSNNIFSSPSYIRERKLPNCSDLLTNKFQNRSSIYKFSIPLNAPSYLHLQTRLNQLQHGGHFFPSHCASQHRVAIIICHRHREVHLRLFLDYIHPFLQEQLLDYVIFVVHQHDHLPFNRGALFNIGFIEAQKFYTFDCFIFHDVDLIPEDLRNLYTCATKPRHMAVAMDKYKYKLPYESYFGGVTSFTRSDYIGANGYANIYWGWGGEDDDAYQRVFRRLKKRIVRYPIEIARYKMIRTHKHQSASQNPHRFELLKSNYNHSLDGLNTVKYKFHRVRFNQLFTLINVSLIEESIEQIRYRLNLTKKTGR